MFMRLPKKDVLPDAQASPSQSPFFRKDSFTWLCFVNKKSGVLKNREFTDHPLVILRRSAEMFQKFLSNRTRYFVSQHGVKSELRSSFIPSNECELILFPVSHDKGWDNARMPGGNV